MPTKRKILKEIESMVKEQSDEKTDIEKWENLTGEKIDKTKAPSIEAKNKLEKEWEFEERERELTESDNFTNEGEIEEEERKGENPYLETEKIIEEESDVEDEEED